MSALQYSPPCRSQFVLQWLEDHAKYFAHPASKPEIPPLVTRIANRSFPSQAESYHYREAVQIRNQVVNNPYIQQSYITSPVKPLPPVRN